MSEILPQVTQFAECVYEALSLFSQCPSTFFEEYSLYLLPTDFSSLEPSSTTLYQRSMLDTLTFKDDDSNLLLCNSASAPLLELVMLIPVDLFDDKVCILPCRSGGTEVVTTVTPSSTAN